MTVKKQVLTELDAICKPETILASNTSGLSITEMAAVTKTSRPGHRRAFLQPGAGDEAGGTDPWLPDQRRHLCREQGVIEKIGKTPIESRKPRGLPSIASFAR